MQFGINGLSSMKVLRTDLTAAVEQLVAGGISYLEPCSLLGANPARFKAAPDTNAVLPILTQLRSLGMDIKGFMVFDDDIVAQSDMIGAFCREHGFTYVSMSYAAYPDLADVYQKAEVMRQATAILKTYGVQFLLHNHDYENNTMIDRDGVEKSILEIFLEQCPDLMLELDMGWMVYAGADTADFIRRHCDRIYALHFKDICADFKTLEEQEIHVACGEGIVPFPEILAAIPEEHKDRLLYILDQDATKGDIIEDHKKSVAYLKGLM